MNAARLLIVHWNQPQACAATVQALLAQKVALHTTVIDNHSAPAAFAELQNSLDRWVEVVRLDENLGWGGALNGLLRRWLSEESEPYCFISAHDAMPEADCLRLLIDALDADSRIGIGCPQYAEPYVVRLSSRRGIFPETVAPQTVGTVQEVDAPHGTLMIVRRECLAEIGLFDERYFAYGDEHDLGVRATRHAWKVVMVWGSIVTNPGTWTASALRSYLFARNSLLLVREYFGRRAAWLRAALLIGNTVRMSAFSRGKDFSARARFRAVRDYFLGRHGKPDLG